MDEIKIFEAGTINAKGVYHKFIASSNREEVQDYIEIMIIVVGNKHEIVFFEKVYNLASTTPHIIRAKE